MDIPAAYHGLIDQALAVTQMSDKLVHVHVGMAIYLLAQLALRTRRGSLDALTVVFALEAINETMDRLYSGSWRVSDTIGDVIATMFWPTMLVLVARYRRRRFARLEQHRAFLAQTGLAPARS